MVSLFKKKSKRGSPGIDANSFESPRISRKLRKAQRNPSTPPVTPESVDDDYNASNLQVRVIADRSSNRSQEEDSVSYYTGDSSTGLKSEENSVTQNQSNTIFGTVLNGMELGCVPWNSAATRAGGSLITIPENSVIASKSAAWGVAPSSSDSEDDSASDASVEKCLHDNFELVLDEKYLKDDCDYYAYDHADSSSESVANELTQKKQKGDQMPVMNNKYGKEIHGMSMMYCQPCEMPAAPQSTKSGIEKEPERKHSSTTAMNANTIDDKQMNHQSQIQVNNKSQVEKMKHPGKKSRSKRNSPVKSVSRSRSWSTSRRSKVGFQEDESIGTDSSISKSRGFSKVLSKRFHKKKKERSKSAGLGVERGGKQKKVKKAAGTGAKQGRWRCAHDAKSGKVYFFHTLTKKVTWDKPEAFDEWRIGTDPMTGKKSYINRITKEARWTKPEGVIEWKPVQDPISGKVYYYNIFTRETSWRKPNETPGEKQVENSQESTIVNNDENGKEEPKPEKTIEKGTPLGDVSTNIMPPPVDAGGGKSNAVVEDVPKVRINEEPNPSTLTLTNRDAFDPVIESPGRQKLAILLVKYCPNDRDINEQLLNKCQGNEQLVIKAIESLAEDTPFDEMHLAVFSYVKNTLRSLGEEPYDENPNFRTKRGPPFSSHASLAKTMSSYSMGSRAISHVTGMTGMTGNTNRTEETNRVNNTTKRSLTLNSALKKIETSEPTTNLPDNQDFDEESIDKVMSDLEKDLLGEHYSTSMADDTKREDRFNKVNLVHQRHRMHADVSSFITRNNGMDEEDTSESDVESAYAADYDDETDDDDTISALSDSFGPSHKSRYLKEMALRDEGKTSSKKLSIMKKKTRLGNNNAVSHYLAKSESKKKFERNLPIENLPSSDPFVNQRRKGFKPKDIEKDHLLPQYVGAQPEDESSWDDDTVTTNSSAVLSGDDKKMIYRD